MSTEKAIKFKQKMYVPDLLNRFKDPGEPMNKLNSS